MARGVAKTSEEKIAEIEAVKAKFQEKIDGYKAKIAELDDQLKAIANEEKEAEVEKLLQAIAASGKSVDEIMAALNK
ncbi:MAG: cortexillin II [Ethanoligenens sp.]|uniref:cortexillin II n=1 Tax=Ethanoligenens sp. TaxID=2099655 RepID=UPI0039E910FD